MNRRAALRKIAYFTLLPTIDFLDLGEQGGCAICGSQKIEWFHSVSDNWEDVSYQCHDCGLDKCMILRMS